MREGDRQARDLKIETMFRKGLAPSNIAERVGLGANRVRDVLRARGHVLSAEVKHEEDPYKSIWTRSADARRFAIWQRAKRAAREALQAPPSVSHTINTTPASDAEKHV